MEIGTCSMVADELARGREMARRLQADIDSGFSVDTCQSLTKEILSVFDKIIFMVTSGAIAVISPESPLAKSQRREGTAPEFEVQQHRVICKKKKMMPKWKSQVRLGSGLGVEGPIDDGYNWRKYGQKDILGAKHPRGYYRCTHRKLQGCLATRQVQRSNDNPSAFVVTYRGTHTCQKRPSANASASRESQQQQQQQHNQDLLLSFQTGLKVETEGLDFESPVPFSVESMKPETFTFSPPSTLDNCLVGLGAFSDVFVSPATSESNYFSMSPCGRMSSYGGQTLQAAAESDFTEIVSALTTSSAANSPMLDMDILQLDSIDLDQEFPFDACSFL